VAEIPVANVEPLRAELDEFVRVLRTGDRPYVDAEDGLWAVAIANALLTAAAEHPSDRPFGPTPEARSRMTIVLRPTRVVSLLGGSIARTRRQSVPPRRTRSADPWTGEPGTAGRAVVVGAGKMGLPLAVQFASHGWHVTAVDVNPEVVAAINEGRSHVAEEPGLAEGVAEVHAAGRLDATTDAAAAARAADVVVLIVPVMLDDAQQPDYRYMDSAVDSIAGGVHPGSHVIFETTLPVGDTRGRFAPRLEAATGLKAETRLLRRVLAGAALLGRRVRQPRHLPQAGRWHRTRVRTPGREFLRLRAGRRDRGHEHAEAAEFSKIADTTYRDVNIALANDFARYADRVGVDIQEVIEGANSQPYSHIHQPGIGVGGHCIPVYPHLSPEPRAGPGGRAVSRRTNDAQVGARHQDPRGLLGGLDDVPVLVLGLTYREGVNELAYSRALPLIERLSFHGAEVRPTTRCSRRGDRTLLRRAICLGRARSRSAPS
jgi:UDP-N-acetyl-D-mannosaminuronate dehydrogenase